MRVTQSESGSLWQPSHGNFSKPALAWLTFSVAPPGRALRGTVGRQDCESLEPCHDCESLEPGGLRESWANPLRGTSKLWQSKPKEEDFLGLGDSDASSESSISPNSCDIRLSVSDCVS